MLVASGSAAPLAVAAGDLHRTLGRRSPTGDDDATRAARRCSASSPTASSSVAVAHVVARRSWWRGPIVGVFNCEYLGRWDVAPRGHPNDGRVDVIDVDATMSMRAAGTGLAASPVGHPRPAPGDPRVPAHGRRAGSSRRPLTLYVDGRRHGAVQPAGRDGRRRRLPPARLTCRGFGGREPSARTPGAGLLA